MKMLRWVHKFRVIGDMRAKVVKSAPKAEPREPKKLICSGERRRGGGALLWADCSENVAAKVDVRIMGVRR